MLGFFFKKRSICINKGFEITLMLKLNAGSLKMFKSIRYSKNMQVRRTRRHFLDFYFFFMDFKICLPPSAEIALKPVQFRKNVEFVCSLE